jgi:electron transport complex protein RnfG
VGKNPASSNLTVTKDGGEIDAITASTITSRGFLRGVDAAYKVFVELQKQQQPWEN